MESALWYMLAGARGGPNRIRILRALSDRPRNANRLADALELDYTTVRHHLDVLCEHDVVERAGEGYGTVYVLADETQENWGTVKEIMDTLDGDDGGNG